MCRPGARIRHFAFLRPLTRTPMMMPMSTTAATPDNNTQTTFARASISSPG
jgi:hypothetical protein